MPSIETDRILTINNHAVGYLDEGDKNAPAILFIHGFPFNKHMWAGQVEALKSEFRVIAYDVRGHGTSDIGNVDFSIDLFVADLINLMDELKIEKALLCGLSMGGYIALHALEQYPNRFVALILCDTQCLADTPEGKEKRMKAIDSIKTNGVDLYAKASIINLFAEVSFQTRRNEIASIQKTIEQTSAETLCQTLLALSQRRETCSRLAEIKIPTLIVVGREDKITPVAAARLMNEKIKHSIMIVIDHAGHLTNLENPSDFNYQLKQFVYPFAKKSHFS
jgi:3-oxoadipate enol-lactonase